MLLKYFYDMKLAHASYLVGCQRAKVALVVDPGRDVSQYLEAAEREGLKLVAVAETHIHADYVSGARELADRVGAKLHLSDEGPAEWKYQYANQYESHLLKDGDTFMLGNIKFEVLHTPGHTPESISFVLTDQGGGADKPMGIFTGDFVFVGSIGRPDLLEQAAGIKDTAEPGARALYRSIARFKQLPDYLQVWPAHGAGSACGKGLGAIPSSTVGYEKLFNPALQLADEDEFVRYILADQPEAPKYFAVMKRVNKEGPIVLGEESLPRLLTTNQLDSALENGTVIDLSTADAFAAGHVPGTINIPTGMLAGWAGWLVDYDRPLYLIGQYEQFPEALRVLRKIGVEHIAGYFRTTDVHKAGLATQLYQSIAADQLAQRISDGQVTLVDVRSDAEWHVAHIPEAEHRFLGRLPQQLEELDDSKPIVVQCQSAARSAIAASVLQAAGKEVINLAGGFAAWVDAGLPVAMDEEVTATCQAATAQCS
ncbi:MAG: MBL fold metallo-hydrolase [Pirellulaceae bacterium]|nr:MBL fold metallo-hydrolase [Planctomycetales bacterium]